MITIDGDEVIIRDEGEPERRVPIGSDEAFERLSALWLRSGWDRKYVYSFSWLGRPIIQLPEDLVRLQEVIWACQPDVIIETGVAHGGGLVFYAGLCRIAGRGRVIGIDVEIRPHNRAAIEAHPLQSLITLIEGDSAAETTVARVGKLIRADERVMVLLDSNHARAHVLAELRAYAPLVTLDSYVVVMDGIMRDLAGAPRSGADWSTNNPCAAMDEFLASDARFRRAEPPFLFNEGEVKRRITYWPGAFLMRVK